MCESPLEFETVLDLCQSRTRRYVLAHFVTRPEPISMARLADVIRRYRSADESGESISEAGDLLLSLQHCHIPKLADAAVIEYDSDRGLIEPTDAISRLEPHLSTLIEADPALQMAIEL